MNLYSNTSGIPINNVVGNCDAADENIGYKSEVKHVFESYQGAGINLANNMLDVVSNPATKREFVDSVMESMTTSPIFTDPAAAGSPFYKNYGARVEQLLDNSMRSVATEAAMIGYAPIVAYNPFFLKKQWIDCVFKDVLMTEIPASPVVNLAFEKRYLKTLDGTRYPLPESLYDETLMKTLIGEATGLAIKEDKIELTALKRLKLINPTYIPGVVADDPSIELTPDLHIFKVIFKDGNTEYERPCNIRVDITTHNFIKGKVTYAVKDASGNTTKTLEDEILGNVDYTTNTVTVISTTGAVTAVCLRGKIANRFNNRSLDVVREVEQLQYTMPESGPRLNTAVTVEDAADALVLQNIDVIADNCDIMGATLANMEDAEIKMFLDDSFVAQKSIGHGPHGYESMIVEGGFNALPYESYMGRISDWMKDSREYFERVIGGLKTKLKTPNAVIVAVAHPNTIRFLQDGINWVFTDDTQISGVKISYNFGIYTSAQDRVHMITSMRMSEDAGIKFVLIPMTQELVTFKHYKYNIIVDRGYRNPLYTLTPNIMATQRTLTFEVLPVQGHMSIDGRDMFSPETLKRPTPPAVVPGA